MAKIYLGLPAYNEEKSIKQLFTRIHRLQASLSAPLVVLFFDDGCQDRTKQEVFAWTSTLEVIYLDGVVNKGLGAGMNALLSEFDMRGQNGDVLVIMDCDDTHDPGQIPQMQEVLNERPDVDVVIASRYRRGATVTGVPFHRILFSIGAIMLYKVVHPIWHARDYTCGYRAYRHKIVRQTLSSFESPLLKERGFSSMVELLLKLNRVGAKMREIPLILTYENKRSASKMNATGNAFRLLSRVLAWRFGGLK